MENPKLKHFQSLIQSQLLPILKESSGMDLNDTIDMFSAQFKESSEFL